MGMDSQGFGGRFAKTHEHRCTSTGVKERNTFAQKPAVNTRRSSLGQGGRKFREESRQDLEVGQ